VSCGAPTPQAVEAGQAPSAPAFPGLATPSLGLAVAALILNVVVIPGLGTVIAQGRGDATGWAQLGLVLVAWLAGGVAFAVTGSALIGFLLYAGVWVWGLVTGVQLVNDAR
jgi:hypothetical protein